MRIVFKNWVLPCAVWGILVVATAPAGAQISSDVPPRTRTVPVREQVESEEENAPYRLGPVRLTPVLSVRDFGWNNNVYGTVDNKVADFQATVAGGARLLLPMGGKAFLRSDAVPEYSWYAKTADRRYFGGAYGGSLLGLFNRVSLEAGGKWSSSLSVLNSESEVVAVQTLSGGRVRLEIDVLERLGLFGGLEQVKSRFSGASGLGAPGVTDLDRTETAARAGLRYRFSDQVSLGVQVEDVKTAFVTQPADRDNSSTGYLVVAHYDREKFYVELTAGYRKSRSSETPSFYPAYSTGTYSYFASWFAGRTVEVQAFGARRPVASLFLDNPYYFENRNGAAVNVGLGERVTLRVLGEVGTNSYPVAVLVAGGAPVTRKDPYWSAGGGFAFVVWRKVQLSVLASQSEYTSNVPGAGRSVFRITTGLSVEGDFSR